MYQLISSVREFLSYLENNSNLLITKIIVKGIPNQMVLLKNLFSMISLNHKLKLLLGYHLLRLILLMHCL